jgi:uncharacterized membrane protein YvbJ
VIKLKTCKECGKKFSETSKFCPNCGKEYRKTTKVKLTQNVSDDYLIYAVLGFIFAFISIFLFPPVFGGLAIWFSRIIKKKGKESLSITLLVISITAMVIGLVVGFINGFFSAL